MNQRTRKLMTMHKVLHSRDDVDYMCQEKKEEEDFPSFKNSVDASIQRLEVYINKTRRKTNYSD